MGLKLSKPAPKLGLKKPGGLAKPGGLTKPGKAKEFGADGPKRQVSKGGAFGAADKAIKKAEMKRNQPYTASIPIGASGVECYFLDEGEPFYMYEHQLGAGPGKRGEIFPCIKDTNENCPGCNKDPKGEGYYVMKLTAVFPVLEGEKKNGEAFKHLWKKLEFNVKIKMVKKYQRLYQAHGTFRGMVVSISRDGEFASATGDDVQFVRMLTEAQIKKYASNPKYKDAKLAEAFDFAKLHKLPSAAELAELIGTTANGAGSADFGTEANDDDDFAATSGGWGDE